MTGSVLTVDGGDDAVSSSSDQGTAGLRPWRWERSASCAHARAQRCADARALQAATRSFFPLRRSVTTR